jgi:aldehyde dehydrogenase (NAD+)
MAFKDAGLPDGVLNIIIGRSNLIQRSLFNNSVLAGVSLTGSYDTASKMRGLIPVEIPFQAELGGKNALVIWKDADQDKAMEIVKASSFRNNGQICTSCGRLLVHSAIAVEFLNKIREYISEVKCDSPDGKLGILSSEIERDNIIERLVRGKGQYKDLIEAQWGSELFGPTVVVEPQSSDLLNEEIFGPVITFEVIYNLEDALEKVNHTSYGLTAGIVTQDLVVAQKFWKLANAGTIKINTPLTGTPFHVPLEGWGRSGAGGGEGGKSSIAFFTRRKAVYIKR